MYIICIFVNSYIHKCIHTYIHSYMHACMHTYIHKYIHTYMHTYIHIYIYIYIYIDFFIYLPIHLHIIVHIYIYTYASAYVCLCLLCVYMIDHNRWIIIGVSPMIWECRRFLLGYLHPETTCDKLKGSRWHGLDMLRSTGVLRSCRISDLMSALFQKERPTGFQSICSEHLQEHP